MVVHRKDTAKRKFKIKKPLIFFERSFLQKILKTVPIGVHKKDMGNKLEIKKNHRKNVLT